MTGLYFETAARPQRADPNRTDVACFIGYVARRAGVPLPPGVRAELDAGGWVSGPWARDAAALDSLLQLPVTVESWDSFARLFAWEQRAVGGGSAARCATYLGAAVRSFFAAGGRRAVIVRAGDPWAFLDGVAADASVRRQRVQALVPGYPDAAAPALPFDATDPRTWRGLDHLFALSEVSLVCVPDLPDVFGDTPPAPPTAFDPPPPPEVFVACSEAEPPLPFDFGLQRLSVARCDQGYEAWGDALGAVRSFLAQHRRDAILLAALPLPSALALRGAGDATVHAEASLLDFLRRTHVLEGDGTSEEGVAATAFIQLAYPWLRTRRSADLPENLEPPEGLLAGVAAANAVRRGTFRSLAGTVLPDVVEPVPMPAWGAGPDSPAEQLAQRLCLVAPDPDGMVLQSDVTTSADLAWRQGGVSRLLGAILRAARRYGDANLFDANGPVLWARLRRSMEQLLTGFWQAGGLAGASAEEAFDVRCGRDTMSQNDIDAGRLVIRVAVLPAAAVERITVVLDTASDGTMQATMREVA